MTKGGGGVSQKMTIADEGGRGVKKCPNLADMICEQPLIINLVAMTFQREVPKSCR